MFKVNNTGPTPQAASLASPQNLPSLKESFFKSIKSLGGKIRAVFKNTITSIKKKSFAILKKMQRS